ncbi:lymphatic vessel endothelial hyaluronic acid receptor 1a [Notothenia coriiceps]|uniref:Lymphatic vessel endothelial hyaluronic acid receptor 1a n=1 Tax=Notothenia coriiceps TaxID=8208 RepID=A0A6I9PRA3_9TELE|nr:PREDICTED: lymphatic vessel endothelial hyaluronic acid receptor 1 [Notothenia coriiceps]
MIWLCFTLVLSFTSVISDQNIDSSHIRVFPGKDQSVAGVFQVSDLNYLNQPQYSYNASDARSLCLSLGVNIASKAQVQEALTRGLETCRFGWIDEHLAVVPRVKALPNCGQNNTGLVTWRVDVRKKLDVFCFNESDAAKQLKDAFADSPSDRTDFSGQTQSSSSRAASSSPTSHSTSSSILSSSSSTPTIDNEAEPAPFVGSSQSSAGAKAILITSTCGLFLIAITILAFIKLRRSRAVSTDIKQAEEYIQTVEWTSEEKTEKTEEAAQEDERMEDERIEDERIEDERMEDERIEVEENAS